MNRSIPKNSISIGYNPYHGQSFFDLLSVYEDYIKEFFFGVNHQLDGAVMNSDAEYEGLCKVDTYGIPANLLINNVGEVYDIWDKIERYRSILNLKGITLIEPEYGPLVKERYPELELNLSVRFWDRNKFLYPIHRLDWLQERGMEVINVSGSYSYNDHALMREIQDRGMKVKFITNEGCIMNRMYNYTELPDCEKYECCPNVLNHVVCYSDCVHVYEKHPWMRFADIDIYKESLDYYSIDVFKISGRFRDINYLTHMLNYWIYAEKTSEIWNHAKIIDISSPEKYKVFHDYVKFRSTECKGHCAKCGLCKHVYDKLILDK